MPRCSLRAAGHDELFFKARFAAVLLGGVCCAVLCCGEQEIKNPLDGIMFARSFIEHTDLTDDQKQLVETSAMCEKQLRRILDDMDLASIEEG